MSTYAGQSVLGVVRALEQAQKRLYHLNQFPFPPMMIYKEVFGSSVVDYFFSMPEQCRKLFETAMGTEEVDPIFPIPHNLIVKIEGVPSELLVRSPRYARMQDTVFFGYAERSTEPSIYLGEQEVRAINNWLAEHQATFSFLSKMEGLVTRSMSEFKNSATLVRALPPLEIIYKPEGKLPRNPESLKHFFAYHLENQFCSTAEETLDHFRHLLVRSLMVEDEDAQPALVVPLE